MKTLLSRSRRANAKPLSFATLVTVTLLFCAAAPAGFAGQGPQPSICTRACWGARGAACGISQMSALSRAIIHHTAGASDWTTSYETAKSKVRGVQNLHMDAN